MYISKYECKYEKEKKHRPRKWRIWTNGGKVKSCAKKLNYCLTIPFLIVTHITLRFTFSKRTQQIKTPKFHLLWDESTCIQTHIYTYTKSQLNMNTHISTHIPTAMIRYYWSIQIPTGCNTNVLYESNIHTHLCPVSWNALL